ncbi:hypothetical protein [Novosphingobium sp. 9U]|uniref:hypothetical protein n=1 Tax=Novosphingobium sp. 9U TaxID=2653158 RepID=UPI0012F3D4EB|nr:hypothetical protein [Novosphingobium sp. 9U]VWX54216.1 conserved hypothetical protein [Novosphingobium sp. 9U]
MSGSGTLTAEAIDHARGDDTGILMPAHEAAFRRGGEAFLTEAFRAFGSISPANSVTRIVRLDPCPGGSTGHKLFLSVEYAFDQPGLARDLFVKFSRDFADSRRDHARYEMESEARFAPVSRAPNFPIRVPTAYFGDFEHASGTGLLITERVAFGRDGIEPQHEKCCDHRIDDPLPYYQALITALARLAAAHKAGQLTDDIEQRFPLDLDKAGPDPIAYDEAALRKVVDGGRQFALDLPQLLPSELRAPELYDRVLAHALRIREHGTRLTEYLVADRDLVALCHWNAHIDNAWFWRDGQGVLQCGLMDWGRVSQITFGAALWGCLSAAHLDIASNDVDGLIALFADQYRVHGGPVVEADRLKQHFFVHVAVMGVARVLALHKAVRLRVPGASQASGPLDPQIVDDEGARTVLHIYTVLLTLWSKSDFQHALDGVLDAASEEVSR